MSAMTKNKNNWMVAKEAIVVTVGARPVRYGQIKVRDRRTNALVEILDTDNDPVDPGDPGVPYAFKSFQRVNKNHPAVKANPGAFLPADEVDEEDIVT